MARLLAFDTATDACAVALHLDGDTLERRDPGPRTHLENLLPMVRELLAEAGCRLAELDAIAFGRGPGSFTGLRIAAATAQGLAFGAGLPALAVSTLEALALGALRRLGGDGVAAALDARQGEVYWALYRRDGERLRRLGDERLCRARSVRWSAGAPAPARCVAAGNGWRLPEAFAALPWRRFAALDADAAPTGGALAELAAAKWAAGEAIDAERAQPIYLRADRAWRPGGGGPKSAGAPSEQR